MERIKDKKFKSLLVFIQKHIEELKYVSEYETKVAKSKFISEYIIQGQNLYLNASPLMDKQDIIFFDNKLSCFANLLYEIMEGLLKDFLEKGRVRQLGTEFAAELLDARDKMLYVAARWKIMRVMNVFDMDKELKKQKVPRRLPLLTAPCFCYDRVIETALGIYHEDGFNPNRGVTCMPPSSGKTYVANCYTNLMLMHFWIRYGETGLIRMTNNSENAKNYGNQCGTMIEDKVWLNVFPELKKYVNAKGVLDCWKNRSAEKLLFKDCNSECTDSIFMFGTDAGINGKRSMLGAVLDDLSNGNDDMDNDELHKRITDKVMSDVMDRSDDDDAPVLVQGTMYNENDTPNTFIELWKKKGLKRLRDNKFIEVTANGKCFTCLVDIEDSKGNSIAPDLYTNEKLKEKRSYFENRGKPYVYNLIYRQKRDSREPKTFDIRYLITYNFNDNSRNLDKYSITMIDTTRKSGKDFFAMPIFRYNKKSGNYRLVDCIFEQKSLGVVDDPRNSFAKKVCNKIIDKQVIECCLESNTSNTTSALLKGICNSMGYKSCKFRDRYTTKKGRVSSKTVRILNMEETIKNYIELPKPDSLPTGHPLSLYMQYLTNWSSTEGQKKSNPDDAPDSLAMFAEEFIFKRKNKGIIKEMPNLW